MKKSLIVGLVALMSSTTYLIDYSLNKIRN